MGFDGENAPLSRISECEAAMEVSKQAAEKPHIVMFPVLGMGHLISMEQLAKSLLAHREFSFTFVTASGQVPDWALAKLSQHPSISSLTLPPVDVSDLPPSSTPVTIMSVVIKRSLEPLRDMLLSIRPISALVLGFLGGDILDVAKDLDIPAYMYFPMAATGLSLLLYLPVLQQRIPREQQDVSELITFPGNLPFKGSEYPETYRDQQDDEYKWILHNARRYREFAGILVNSFDELEPKPVKLLLEGREFEGDIPPVYPIGPLVKAPEEDAAGDRTACLRWLDEQPRGSVLFVSFGSFGSITQEQLTELALGLEASGQRFLWVVKKPRAPSSTAPFASGRMEESELPAFLPGGFRERTSGVGLVVAEWAPQVQILSHEAIGGFLSHCGWNSSLESVVHGVPLIGWPLYVDQRMNARKLADMIGIGVNVDYEQELVTQEEVERMVRLLMESETGTKLRARAAELRMAAAEALSEEGLSYQRLAHLTRLIGSGKHPSVRAAGDQVSLENHHYA